MKLIDYSLYDDLHNELVKHYGSEMKLRLAIMMNQHPIAYAAMYGAALNSGVRALRQANRAMNDFAKECGKIKIKIDLFK